MTHQAANSTPGNRMANKGIISVKLPNLDAFNDSKGKPKQIASTVHKIDGLSWQMNIRKVVKSAKSYLFDTEKTMLNLYIACNEDVKEHLWLCKVQFTVEIWLSDNPLKPDFYRSYGHFYGFNSLNWILPVENISHKLRKNPFEIRLELKMCQVLQKSLPALDTSLVVNMDGGHAETLFVNKHALASLSSYFRNLFFEDWNDKKKEEGKHFELYELDAFDMEAFKLMIYGSMNLGWMLNDQAIFTYSQSLQIVKLAIKYDFAVMLEYCEKILLDTKQSPCPLMDMLQFADQYSLVQLKEHCLNQLGVLDFMEEFGKNLKSHSRLSKATQEELQAKLDAKAKSSRSSAENLRYNLERRIQADPANSGMGFPFNELAKALLGQGASTVSDSSKA